MDFKTWCKTHYPKKGTFTSPNDYICCDHERGEDNPSLSFSTKDGGKWHCFATDKGGDIRFFCRERGIEPWDGARKWEENPRGNDLPTAPPRPEPEESAEDAAKTEHARALWNRAGYAEDHAYLVGKQIPGDRLKQIGDELLVPGVDVDNVLRCIERIQPDGEKKSLGKTGPDEKLGDVFISAPVFERRESTDRSRDVIAHSGIENRPLPREDVATVISRICKIEDDSDILAIVGEYGPLRIDAEWKNFMNIWRWRCDTPQEWRELSVLVNEVFYLLRAIERKLPDIDAARSRLIDILSEHVNEANVRTYYSVLPSGDIASTSGVAFDLHAAIWKVLESTVVSSKATEHLRLRKCHYCGEWDFEKGGEGGRRIRQRSDKAFWYHDGCWRNEEKTSERCRESRDGREEAEKQTGSAEGEPL